MDKNHAQAHAVIDALQEFEKRIDVILERVEGKRNVSQDEKKQLQALLTSLKKDLKAAAKHSPTNQYEKAYFSPAVTAAAANLTVAVNSHPISSNWHSLSVWRSHRHQSHAGSTKAGVPSIVAI